MKKGLLFFTILLWTLFLYSADNPNIIVVLADDIGLGDISHYRRMHANNIILETPNIDRLAEHGMTFSNAHSPAALCAPSRFAIMTGNSCYRSPYPWGVWGSYEESPIKADQLTLGKLMKQAGYTTGFFGKWHLGGDYYRADDSKTLYRGSRYNPETEVDITRIIGGGPQQNGFDYSFTYPAGIQDVPYAVYENGKWIPLSEDSEISFISQANMTKINVKLDKMEGMGDSNWDPHNMGPLLIDKAVDYIKDNSGKKQPFFMYYCSQAVHLPHSPPAEINGVKIAGTTPSKHMDMIKELDVQMGVLLETLWEQGIYENTIIIFTSDNGGLFVDQNTLKSGHKPSDIYRGGKNSAFEGGHRVPFIASWPGKIEKNILSHEPILGLDILATLAAVIKQEIADNQAMDSYNLLPVLLNENNAENHAYLMLQGGTGLELIIIEDGWKLILKKDKNSGKMNALALFDLNTNPEEDEELNLVNNKDYKNKVKTLLTKYSKIKESGSATGNHLSL